MNLNILKMKTKNIAIINNISLQVVADEREQLVAVKPVCEILGVAWQSQLAKLKEHPIFGSVITLSVTTGADGKEYEMVCLPLRYFPSWVFSINPNNVKEDIRGNLLEYQKKCNDILYDYFFSRVDFSRKKEVAVTKAKEVCDEKVEPLCRETSGFIRIERTGGRHQSVLLPIIDYRGRVDIVEGGAAYE